MKLIGDYKYRKEDNEGCHFCKQSMLQVSVFNVGITITDPEQGHKQLILLVKDRVQLYGIMKRKFKHREKQIMKTNV